MPATLDDLAVILAEIRDLLKNGPPARPASPQSNGSGASGQLPLGAVFPNYGRAKGQPVQGANMGDLEFYANGCRKTLADPAKSRWHDKERALLAAIDAEMARQNGGGPSQNAPTDAPASNPDDDLPF